MSCETLATPPSAIFTSGTEVHRVALGPGVALGTTFEVRPEDVEPRDFESPY
jgi:hypothetical protein